MRVAWTGGLAATPQNPFRECESSPSVSRRIRVLVIDDHWIIREGLRAVARCQTGIEISGEGGCASEVMPLFLAHRPDVLLLDLQLGTDSGLTVLRNLLAEHPAARVVVLTNYSDEAHVCAAISAGAHGYVLKEADPAQIFDAIRAVHGGRRYLAPEISFALTPQRRTPILTTRERDVLDLLVRGERNKCIGSLLGLAEETVKSHVRNILRKLGACSRTEAARKAVEGSLVNRGN